MSLILCCIQSKSHECLIMIIPRPDPSYHAPSQAGRRILLNCQERFGPRNGQEFFVLEQRCAIDQNRSDVPQTAPVELSSATKDHFLFSSPTQAENRLQVSVRLFKPIGALQSLHVGGNMTKYETDLAEKQASNQTLKRPIYTAKCTRKRIGSSVSNQIKRIESDIMNESIYKIKKNTAILYRFCIDFAW